MIVTGFLLALVITMAVIPFVRRRAIAAGGTERSSAPAEG